MSPFKKATVELTKYQTGLEKGGEGEQRYKSPLAWAENSPASQRRDLVALCGVGVKLNGEQSLPPGLLGAGLVQNAYGNIRGLFFIGCFRLGYFCLFWLVDWFMFSFGLICFGLINFVLF